MGLDFVLERRSVGSTEGMVLDAREMADDVEAKVRDWRQVEGAAANVRAANTDKDDEEDGAVGGDKKRRKV